VNDEDVFLWINLWADRAGEIEAAAFKRREEALEEIAADYANLRYLGTVLVTREGVRAPEDWSEDARRHREGVVQDWIEEQRERQAIRQRVL
jgi:hypothetical protein